MSDLASAIFEPLDSVKTECGVFDRIQVLPQASGGHTLAWGLRPDFRASGPFHFYVEFGRAGMQDEDWEALNRSPIVNDCTYFDSKQRYWDHLPDFYYRLRLVLPGQLVDGLPAVHLSQLQQANGIWSKRDWLQARDIARKEYLLQRKRTNKTAVGWLLKRRRWGEPCTRCLDHDTQEVQDGGCPVCYGTGYRYGYFPALYFVATMDAPWNREFKRDPNLGTINQVVRQGRAVAYPYTDTNDVFVRQDTGERYYVNAISTLAEIGNIPVITGLELRLAPVTDVIYQVPLLGEASSSGSQIPPAPVITSAAALTATTLQPFSYQIQATGDPNSYSAVGLPDGLSLNTATGLITGAPTVAGQVTFTVRATNDFGTGSLVVTLTLKAVWMVDGQPIIVD